MTDNGRTRRTRKRLALLAVPMFLLGGASLLGGCAPVVFGGAAAGGVAVAQERTVGDAFDDTRIKLELNGKLLGSPREGVFSGVEIEVVEGRVLLAGTVPLPEDRIEVARMAWTTPGVKNVINEIQVGDSSGIVDFAKDTWITAQLRTKLLFDENVRSINYTVETVNGTVYLIGISRSPEEEARVTGHAARIAGVQKVVSYIVPVDDPSRQPQPLPRPQG